jgi:hypothetical protein
MIEVSRRLDGQAKASGVVPSIDHRNYRMPIDRAQSGEPHLRKAGHRHGGHSMKLPTPPVLALALAALAIGVAGGAAFLFLQPAHSELHADLCTGPPNADEAPFLAENGTAMTKMMNDMAVKPTGDVDVDFVAMMVPHHQGAIDMALAVLRYGHNSQIKRLAQEIIVTQQQEIAAMRLAVNQPLPPSLASPTQASAASAPDHRSMAHDSMKTSPRMGMQ